MNNATTGATGATGALVAVIVEGKAAMRDGRLRRHPSLAMTDSTNKCHDRQAQRGPRFELELIDVNNIED